MKLQKCTEDRDLDHHGPKESANVAATGIRTKSEKTICSNQAQTENFLENFEINLL